MQSDPLRDRGARPRMCRTLRSDKDSRFGKTPRVPWQPMYARFLAPFCRSAKGRYPPHSCPSRQTLRTGGERERERTLAEDVGCARARRFVFGSSGCSSPTFSVSAAPPPKSVASFTISPTGSPATCATCDVRHSTDQKCASFDLCAQLNEKTALGGCA